MIKGGIDFSDLMEHHGVKPTANRILICRAIASCEGPASLSELEDILPTVDKSNIFRALQLFKERHVVHAVEGSGDVTRYELCLSHEDGDDDIHVHFYCEKCGKTFCLYGVDIPEVPLPEGFVKATANYVIKGLCTSCAAKDA